MPRYRFRLRPKSDADASAIPCREFPDLAAAMAAARGVAQSYLRAPMAHLSARSRIDIEDEANRPIARILLSEMARQIR